MDRVASKNIVCPHCGYTLRGVKIIDQQITCPECGTAALLGDAPPHPAPSRRRGLINLAAILLPAAIAAVLWYFDPRAPGLLIVGVFLGLSIVTWLMVRGGRRLFKS